MTLDRQLDTLEASGLISKAAMLPELEYLFRHALIQDAASASLLKSDRRNLHRLVGEALEPSFAQRPAEVASVLALHFAAAGEPERALRYYIFAGEAAASRYANAEAANFYDAAIALARAMPAFPCVQLQELYLLRGRVLELQARDREALASYEELERLGRERRQPELELAALIARMTIYASARDMRDPVLVDELSKHALDLASSMDDRAAEAKILWNLMHKERDMIHYRASADYGERSLQIARELGLREQMAYTLNDLTLTYMVMSRFDQAAATRRQALALWRELHNLPMVSESLMYAATHHVIQGELDESLTASRESQQIAQQINNLWGQSASMLPMSLALLERGEIDAAVQAMREGVRLGEQAGFIPGPAQLNADLARVYATMGDPAQGLTFARRALQKTELFPTYRLYALGALAIVHLSGGHIEEAARIVATGFPELENPDVFPLSRFALLTAAIELALAQSDFGRAAFIAEMALGPAREHSVRLYLPALLGLHARALLGMGQLDEAWQQAQGAVQVAQSMTARWSLWPVLEL